MIKLTNII